MPRRAQGPRLYLDTSRMQWVIRDGSNFVRTGCPESDREGAEKRLAEHIGAKYQPTPSPSPPIADVLLAYSRERLANVPSGPNTAWNIKNLIEFWGSKNVQNITPNSCKEYVATKSVGGA